MSDISYLKVSGSNYDIGYKIGKTFQRPMQATLELCRSYYEREFNQSFDQAREKAFPLQKYAQKSLPHLFQELEGMAQGSRIPFNDLFVLNAEEFLYESRLVQSRVPFKGCTTLSVVNNGALTIAHNEDWASDYQNRLFVLQADVQGKMERVQFISLCYYGKLAGYAISLNSHGLIQTSDGVYALDAQVGTPKCFVNRYAMESETIKEATRRAASLPRASGTNLIYGIGTQMAALELSAQQFDLVHAKSNKFAHTNHYLSPMMKSLNKPSENTLLRLSRAHQLLDAVTNPSREYLHSILADHANAPNSICGHSSDVLQTQKTKSATLASVIINPSENRFSVLNGSPCREKFRDFYLDN